MKLFRSKSSSSPSRATRFSRMLSPTSKKSNTISAPIQHAPSPSPSSQELPPSAPPELDLNLDFEPFPTPSIDKPQHEAELSPPHNQQYQEHAKENESPNTVNRKPQAHDNREDPEHSHVGTDITAPFDERAMTRKLNDMESSFLPEHDEGTFVADAESFPFREEATDGFAANARYVNRAASDADDGETDSLRMAKSQTFLKWGPGYALPRSPSAKMGSRIVSVGFRPHGSVQEAKEEKIHGLSTAEEDARQASTAEGEDEVDYGDSTLDSPTMAISQRYGAGGSARQQSTRHDVVTDVSPSPSPEESNAEANGHVHDSSNGRTHPAQLRDRHISQESTTSYQSAALSESTIGADYAIQSGGAIPEKQKSHRPTRDEMMRLPSFGSVASSLTEPQETSVIRRTDLSPYNEGGYPEDTQLPQSELETPRAQRKPAFDPTETVLNQRVRDVQVPETVARQYRASHLSTASDDTRVQPTQSYGHSKNSLTLKEQNSKIDKLTKENFDLKLKIHFLTQALQDRSEEGVKDLISKNAQYQAELVRSKKDNQTLKKRIRALEKQLGMAARGSVASTTTGSQVDSEEGSGPGSQPVQPVTDPSDLERLRERILTLETENEKILQAWQEVLDQEIDRRRQAELKVQELQHDFTKYKASRSPLRKLTLKRSQGRLGGGDDDSNNSVGRMSEAQERASSVTHDRVDLASLGGTTVVEQLKQENSTLRRDLDVQTDMLSSRNRERERLQHEIETLKLITRREESSKSSAGDSILEHSISRQHLRGRPASRGSLGQSSLSDPERDRYESLQAHLRDENATLKMRIHDLQTEMDELERLHVPRADADQALQEADADIQYLTDAVRHLEGVLQEKDNQLNGLWTDLRTREDENEAFKRELESISSSLDEVAGDRNGTHHFIANLQREVDSANAEVEALEEALRNVTSAKERLEVQQESAQNEIAFLREEQESDKVKIGDLQTSLGNVNKNLANEIERLKQFEQLEAGAASAREEGHRLRQALVMKETEAAAHASQVKELERNLREAQASRTTGSTKDISRLRRDLEDALAELNHANASIREKDRTIVEREDLLDQMEAELQHERQINKRAARSQSTASNDARLTQLEQARAKEKEQYTALLTQRNALLTTLHTRLTAICGPTYKSRMQSDLVNDKSLASHNLPQLQASLTSALAHLETIIKSFPAQLRNVEQEIWVDFQTLDTALASRILRLDHLEQRVKTTAKIRADEGEELRKVKEENEMLQKEIRQAGAGAGALTTARASASTNIAASSAGNGNQDDNSEAKWIWRIEEMNRRLKAEREGRLLDRDGASKRLQEGQREIRELRRALERTKIGGGGANNSSGGGGRVAEGANVEGRTRGMSNAGSVD